VIGWVLGRWFGRPVLLKIVSAKRSQRVEALFARYGVLVVLIAAFTPIPYKVFAITAGVLKFDVRPFIAISFVGRGARFFLLAGLIFYLDSTDSMEAVSGNFVAITSGVLGIGVLLGAVIGAIRWAVKRWR
jgi:membrane protein YqaA with SNARE-associated domain